MTIEDLAARVDEQGKALERIEEQNKALLRALGEALQILRTRQSRAVTPAAGEQIELRRSRWNHNGWWEMFLEGTGWVRDWHNKAPAPGGAR